MRSIGRLGLAAGASWALAACAIAETPATAPVAPAATAPDAALVQAVEAYHAKRIERLTAQDGWLTLTGLDWLDDEGAAAVGSAEGSHVRLPESAPAAFGTLTRTGTDVTLQLAEGVSATANDAPITGPVILLPDQHADGPTRVASGNVSFYVIDRDGRLGVRIKDRAAPARTGFTGVPRFPIDAAHRVTARLERHDPPVDLEIPTVLGTVTKEPSPGVLVFELGGQTHRLHPVGEPDQSLFIVFGDTTNGDTSYGGGRFLSTGAVGTDDTVELDFNRAINPPCAFSPYATCPLPPRSNKLAVAVVAGEKVPEGAAGH